jgi:hypothetical protein
VAPVLALRICPNASPELAAWRLDDRPAVEPMEGKAWALLGSMATPDTQDLSGESGASLAQQVPGQRWTGEKHCDVNRLSSAARIARRAPGRACRLPGRNCRAAADPKLWCGPQVSLRAQASCMIYA